MDAGLQKCFDQIRDVSALLWERGWAERNAGNISVRLPEMDNPFLETQKEYPYLKSDQVLTGLAGIQMVVSGTGKRMREIAIDPASGVSKILISEDESGYYLMREGTGEDDYKPSSELPTHLEIHKKLIGNQTNRKAILHTHPQELIAITHIPEFKQSEKLTRLIWRMHPESIFFLPDGIAVLPYQMPGTTDIAKNTAALFGKYPVVVWEKHGCFAAGNDLYEAFDVVDMVVKTIQIFIMVKSAGFDPEGLNEDQLRDLKENYRI